MTNLTKKTLALAATAVLAAGCANWHPYGSQEMRTGMVADWYNDARLHLRQGHAQSEQLRRLLRFDLAAVPAGRRRAPMGDFTVIKRVDGSPQWAYKGMPLNTYTKDTKTATRTATAPVASGTRCSSSSATRSLDRFRHGRGDPNETETAREGRLAFVVPGGSTRTSGGPPWATTSRRSPGSSDHTDHQSAIRSSGVASDRRSGDLQAARIGLGLSPERRRGPGAPADRAAS